MISAIGARYAGTAEDVTGRHPAIVFPAVSDAVACMLALQSELPPDLVLPRAAVHVGEIGSGLVGAFLGSALVHCDWLRESASRGQVVLSQASAEQVSGRLPSDCTLSDLGYEGSIGLEYKPSGSTAESLATLRQALGISA